MFVSKFFQYIFRSRILAGLGFFGFVIQMQPVKQYFSDLQRRIDIEFSAGQLKNFLFDLHHVFRKNFGTLTQSFTVDAYSCFFHYHQNLHKRHFNFIKQFLEFIGCQFLFQHLFQTKRNICIFSSIFHEFGNFHVSDIQLIFPFCSY